MLCASIVVATFLILLCVRIVYPSSRPSDENRCNLPMGRIMLVVFNKMKKIVGAAVVAAFLSGVALLPATAASDPKSNLVTIAADKQKRDPSLVLTQGMAEVVPIEGDVSDVMVANPSVVEVSALKNNQLYIVGLNLGTTNVIVTDVEGNVIQRLNIHVKIDDITIQKAVNELFPDEEVKIRSMTDQVVISGTVSNPGVAERIINLVNQYVGEVKNAKGVADSTIVNLLDVRGEQQVMLRVKILEVSRNALRELGVEPNLTAGATTNNLTGSIATTAGTGLTEDPFSVGTVIFNALDHVGQLNVLLKALENDGLINTLAEPNLTAISGEKAGFLAGGEYPVPVGRDQNGNITIEFKQFGVSLNFKPTVLSGERISMQMETEVSSLDNENAITLASVTVPGLDVRRASTTVELGSGGSLMIAGLMQAKTVKGLSGVPGIKDAPVIGKLMSSESFKREETELVVIVTPYLVEPYADRTQAVETTPVPASFGKRVDGNGRSDDGSAPVQSTALSRAFSYNMRRIYGEDATSSMNSGGSVYGYILD